MRALPWGYPEPRLRRSGTRHTTRRHAARRLSSREDSYAEKAAMKTILGALVLGTPNAHAVTLLPFRS
jgi:hypothetical protein